MAEDAAKLSAHSAIPSWLCRGQPHVRAKLEGGCGIDAHLREPPELCMHHRRALHQLPHRFHCSTVQLRVRPRRVLSQVAHIQLPDVAVDVRIRICDCSVSSPVRPLPQLLSVGPRPPMLGRIHALADPTIQNVFPGRKLRDKACVGCHRMERLRCGGLAGRSLGRGVGGGRLEGGSGGSHWSAPATSSWECRGSSRSRSGWLLQDSVASSLRCLLFSENGWVDLVDRRQHSVRVRHEGHVAGRCSSSQASREHRSGGGVHAHAKRTVEGDSGISLANSFHKGAARSIRPILPVDRILYSCGSSINQLPSCHGTSHYACWPSKSPQ
mmetsp:Transcript_32004/g.75409  ORF Transcript_32004/g.75409 Transcript_32004/m.75409 type:complete len:326 (-) Transcript_32004:404-1381(-)